MKYLIFCLLVLSILNAKAQKKMSFDLQFDAGAVFSRSKPVIKYSPGAFGYDPNTGTTIYMPGTLRTTNEYKNILTPQFALGLKANYTIKQNFKVYAGLSFSYVEAKRKNTLIIPSPFNNNESFEFITNELLKFYNVNFPIGVTYIYDKWSLNFGITPSIILNSKFTEMKEKPADPPEISPWYPWTNDPTYPRPSSANKAKNYISLSISPLYQLNSKLKIGIEYNHGLTKSYYADDYSTEYYQSMKTSTLGLKILYKLY